jgi:hypothetical protein
VAQVVEWLPSKWEALSSNTGMAKKKKSFIEKHTHVPKLTFKKISVFWIILATVLSAYHRGNWTFSNEQTQ